MAEQYIIGNNAQFNDSVEILKDLTLYGVVENSTDFAVKIQGDEQLRITSDGVEFKESLSHIGDTDTKIKFVNNQISLETNGFERVIVDPSGNLNTRADIRLRRTSTNDGALFFGDSNNNFIFGSDADDVLTFATGGTERLRIISGGMLIKGHTESAGQIDTQLNPQNQFHGNDRKGGIRITDFSDSQFPASLQFVKSRNPTIDQNTILQDGDQMGSIYWGGANGTNFQPGAFLLAKTDGTVSSTSMPTALSFGTNEGNSLVERFRIDPDGRATFFGTNEQDIIHISTGNAAGNTFANIRGDNESGIRIRGGGSYDGGTIELAAGLRDTDPGIIKFSSGTGSTTGERMRILSNGRVLINTTSSINSQAYLEVQGGTSNGQTNYIQTWKGDSDNLALRNQAAGDYEFTNSQAGNQVAIYDGSGGARLEYYDNGNYIGITNNLASSNIAHAATTTGGVNLNISGSGSTFAIRRSSSSQRYKDNIREYVGLGVSAIKQMIPKLWEDHNEGFTKLGFIAEDIHNIGLTNAVEYEEYVGGSEIGIGVTYGVMYGNGTTPVTKTGEALDDEVLVVDGIDNTAIIAELVVAVKQLTARIETLESGG